MSQLAATDGEEAAWRRFVAPGIFLLVLVLIAAGIWRLSQNDAGMRKEAPKLDVVSLTPPPPPPPPPPPKEQPPEPTPEKMVDVPTPTPQPQAQPQQLTIAGPAQAGGDAFGLQAGSGGGQVGSGGGSGPSGGDFGASAYARYLGGVLQEAVQSDKRVNRLVFTAELALWVDAEGRVTRAAILRSSGNARTDQALVLTLQSVGRLDEAPPATVKFPQHVTVRGRKA